MSYQSSSIVSVIVPTYRRSKYLKEAIIALQKQTYSHIQIRVYDDASGDDTKDMVLEMATEDPRIIYHYNEKNLGMYLNYKKSMEEIDTPYFAICADDDLFLPEHIEWAMQGFELYPEAVFSTNQQLTIDSQFRIIHVNFENCQKGFYTSGEGLLFLLKNCPSVVLGSVYRKEVLDTVGTLGPECGALWDWDFSIQIAARYPMVFNKKVGTIFRLHSNNQVEIDMTTFQWPKWLKFYQKLIDISAGQELQNKEDCIRILRNRLRSLVYNQGKQSILNKDFYMYPLSAKIMKEFFGSPRHYLKLYCFGIFCKWFPPYLWYLRFIKEMRTKKKLFKASIHYQKYKPYKKFVSNLVDKTG